jgi:FdhD protein
MAVMSDRRRVTRVAVPGAGEPATCIEQGDELTVEAPLSLVLDGEVIATLMRTPGNDVELAAGWLVVESGVRTAADIETLRQCHVEPDELTEDLGEAARRRMDQVHLTLAPGVRAPRPRAWVTGAACGVCSADVLDLRSLRWPTASAAGPVSVAVLQSLPDALRERQRVFARTGSLHAAVVLRAPVEARRAQRGFERTGGLHATALFDADGGMLVVREDVGRHNAVDKVAGWALLNSRLPASQLLLVVSGRVSFEIVQKAVASGVSGIVAVSAPSDLAVDLAEEHDLLLVGMMRSGRMNVYTGRNRVDMTV